MAIGVLNTVKDMLGISLADTTLDSFLSEILDAVDDWLENACNRQFANATYSFQKYGTDDDILSLPNRPVNSILWSARGATGVIDVEYTGSTTGLLSVQDNVLTLSENLSATTIDLTASGISTISDVATQINNQSSWSATASTLYGSYPARILLDRIYDHVTSINTTFSIVAALSPMNLQQRQDGLYRIIDCNSVGDNTIMLVIYDGGYSTYPDGLIYAASKIAADAYQYLTRDGAIHEEELGDYRYVLENEFRNDAVKANWPTIGQYANISA